MFTISIRTESASSSVPVTRISELEPAISFGFQLHQIASLKHYIVVADSDGNSVATFIRKDSITLPTSPSGDKPASDGKKVFGLRKKS